MAQTMNGSASEVWVRLMDDWAAYLQEVRGQVVALRR